MSHGGAEGLGVAQAALNTTHNAVLVGVALSAHKAER